MVPTGKPWGPGLLFRRGDKCYRPIAAEAKKPAP